MAKSTTDDGKKILFKDNDFASKFFGRGQDKMVLAPKRKFLYFAWFEGTEYTMPFLVKSVDTPSFSVATETLDQYNRKRIVQTRTNYDPIAVRFHDDSDHQVAAMFANLLMFNNKDFLEKTPDEWSRGILTDFAEREYGQNYKANFTAFHIAKINNGQVHITTLYNPVVSDFKYDSLDYADSNPLEIALTVEYEGVFFETDNNTKAAKYALDAVLTSDLLGQHGAPLG